MPTSGSVTFEPLSASSGSWGFPEFEELSVSGSARGPNSVEFEELTASGTAHGAAAGTAEFERLTAEGETVPVNVVSGAAIFEALEVAGGVNAEGSVIFEELFAAGQARAPVSGSVAFKALEVRHISGYVQFDPLVAT